MKAIAFSLIELLVVIAIVGVLAAIAAPAYKHYVSNAKIPTIVAAMNALIDKNVNFSAAHGKFTNDVTQLGYAEDQLAGDQFCFDISAIPYTPTTSIFGCPIELVGNPNQGFLILEVTVDTTQIGISYPTLVLECFFGNINGVVQKQWVFFIGDVNGASDPTWRIPGMLNGNNGTGWDGQGYFEIENYFINNASN